MNVEDVALPPRRVDRYVSEGKANRSEVGCAPCTSRAQKKDKTGGIAREPCSCCLHLPVGNVPAGVCLLPNCSQSPLIIPVLFPETPREGRGWGVRMWDSDRQCLFTLGEAMSVNYTFLRDPLGESLVEAVLVQTW